MSEPRKAWFGPKAYGYGYSPITWEGWLATAALVVVILLGATVVGPIAGPIGVACVIAGALGGYVWLISRHFEGDLGWRWGGRRTK